MRWLALLAPLILLTVATARSAPDPRLAQLEQTTQSIRHLKQLRPVKAVFPSAARFNAAFNAEMHRDSPDNEIAYGQRESVLLGELQPGQSLKRILFQGIGAQVAGFYDYRDKVLYVRNGSQALSAAWRWTIAHEYTHALQDQHYGLARLMPDEGKVAYRNSDAIGAHHALTEGDAVTTQQLFIERTYSRADMQALLYAQNHLPKTPPVPKAIQRSFDFPYGPGVTFVQRLYARGGESAVDAAYHRLPSSTYEIMHPAAYLNGWKPVDVAIHGVKGFGGWKQIDDDVQGCFGYNLLLWQFLPKTRADAVTDAYRGDRYLFFERGRHNAMLLASVWNSPSSAVSAERALLDSLRIRYGSRFSAAGAHTYRTADGGVYLIRNGTRVVMAFAPSPALAGKLGTARTT